MKNHKFDTQRIMADAWKHAEYMAVEPRRPQVSVFFILPA